jgi:hypothetical protein
MYLLGALALLIALGPSTCAQTDCDQHPGGIHSVNRVPHDDRKLDVNFTSVVTANDLQTTGQPDSWLIIDVTDTSPNNRYYVVGPVERNDRKPMDPQDNHIPGVFLILNRPLNHSHEYRVFQSRLTFNGCPLKGTIEGTVAAEQDDHSGGTTGGMTGGTTGGAQVPPKKEGSFLGNLLGLGHKSPSKGRNDSNVYLSGEIDGAHGAKTQFSTDTKLDLPHSTNGLFGEVGLFFDLKASTAKSADADSMDFGVKLRTGHIFHRRLDPDGRFHVPDKRIITGITFDLMPGIESDRRFRNINTLLGLKLSFVTNSTRIFGQTLGNAIYLQPFIGYEIGRNIKSPVDAAQGRGVSRGTAGASLYVNLTPGRTSGLSFQADYVRRFLLRRETSFTQDDNKKLIPLGVGKGPRDYVKSTFEFDLTDFTGITLSHEYGRLPPNFDLVDNKFSFGLVHKFSTKSK